MYTMICIVAIIFILACKPIIVNHTVNVEVLIDANLTGVDDEAEDG